MVKFINLFFVAVFGLSTTLNAYAINSNSIIKQTNLSSITANEVNINAKGNTHLKGSLIAAGEYDNDGKFIDNGNLNLSTNTLTYENLANTSYNKSSNLNISANLINLVKFIKFAFVQIYDLKNTQQTTH